jgi:gliding motility-associated-like protein
MSENIKLGVIQPQKLIKNPPADTLKIFNFVTANGDSKNDFFTIEGLQKIQDYELTIFNRLGNIILNTRQYENDWNGQDLETGTYFYLFKYNNQELKNVIFLSK